MVMDLVQKFSRNNFDVAEIFEVLGFIAVSVEQVLQIVYQPQAVFRIKPVTRCSASIAGECHAFSHDFVGHTHLSYFLRG